VLENLQSEEVITEQAPEVEQPLEPVAGEEGVSEPQDTSEAEEFELALPSDEQASQESTEESKPKSKLVPVGKFNKVRHQKNELRDENAELKKQIEELRTSVASVARGAPPEIHEYDSTQEYLAALKDWESKGVPQSNLTPDPEQTQSAEQAQAFEYQMPTAEIEAHQQRVEALPTGLAGQYIESENALIDDLDKAFAGVGQQLAAEIVKQSGDKSELVLLALGDGRRRAALVNKLEQDRVTGGNAALDYIYQLKYNPDLQLKPKKRVSTQPEEIPDAGKGSVQSLSLSVNKAFEKWQETNSAEDYKKYRELKKAMKKGN
jgi:hypothetical protein